MQGVQGNINPAGGAGAAAGADDAEAIIQRRRRRDDDDEEEEEASRRRRRLLALLLRQRMMLMYALSRQSLVGGRAVRSTRWYDDVVPAMSGPRLTTGSDTTTPSKQGLAAGVRKVRRAGRRDC